MRPKMTRTKRAEAWAYVHLGLFGTPDEGSLDESDDDRE